MRSPSCELSRRAVLPPALKPGQHHGNWRHAGLLIQRQEYKRMLNKILRIVALSLALFTMGGNVELRADDPVPCWPPCDGGGK